MKKEFKVEDRIMGMGKDGRIVAGTVKKVEISGGLFFNYYLVDNKDLGHGGAIDMGRAIQFDDEKFTKAIICEEKIRENREKMIQLMSPEDD